jgi:hypothetical protein
VGECARTWGIPKWFAHLLVATATCNTCVLLHHGPNPTKQNLFPHPAAAGPYPLDTALLRVGATHCRAGEGEMPSVAGIPAWCLSPTGVRTLRQWHTKHTIHCSSPHTNSCTLRTISDAGSLGNGTPAEQAASQAACARADV